MESICLDFLSMEISTDDTATILIITHQVVANRNHTARTTTEVLSNSYVVHYSIPNWLPSNQGSNIESYVLLELCQLLGTQKSGTTP